MARQRKQRLSMVLRRALRESERSRYELARRTGIAESVLCRFLHRDTSMSLGNVDRLAAALGLELRPVRKGVQRG